MPRRTEIFRERQRRRKIRMRIAKLERRAEKAGKK